MKLPSSSSLLLATLAISSSSSSLAAPAGESDAAITTSSSNHNISTLLSSPNIGDLGSGSADIHSEQRASVNVDRSEESDTHQNSLVSALLQLLHNLPIIGHPVASLIEKSFPNGTDSVQRMPVISADDLQALHAAIAEVSRVLSSGNQTLGASSAVQSVAPIAISNGNASDPTNTTSSVSSPSTAAADGNTTMDVAAFTSAPQSSPPTPIIPGNPPNTPVPPAA